MAQIDRLSISRVRNIDDVSLFPGPRINLIQGPNGSGKTSILESVYLLGVGRSFRSAKIAPVIQNGVSQCTVFAELDCGTVSMGLQKFRNQRHVLKVQGQKQGNWLEAARHLPVQILDSHAFMLLEGSPKVRRRFLDWGVFHVEPGFAQQWSNSRKCIANRNLLLKSTRIDRDQVHAWTVELAREGEGVDASRLAYFNDFSPVFRDIFAKLLGFDDITLSYFRGWDSETTLLDALDDSLEADIRYGATQFGPHRADIRVKVGRNLAIDVLSRGQQKLLVSALKIAQGRLLADRVHKHCLFLVDDLPAELDQANRHGVCELLSSLGGQVFATCVDEKSLINCWDTGVPVTRFHVEHGKLCD